VTIGHIVVNVEEIPKQLDRMHRIYRILLDLLKENYNSCNPVNPVDPVHKRSLLDHNGKHTSEIYLEA
jgi:hypothetical protein